MRRGIAKVAAVGVLAAVPAVALASSNVYSGVATGDPDAEIELKISSGDEPRVKQVVVKDLPYTFGDGCIDSGRSPRAKLRGDFRVKDNGEFRAVGLGETNDPLTDGQINVVGKLTNKVKGEMKFTFGKTGCQTQKLEFKAFQAVR